MGVILALRVFGFELNSQLRTKIPTQPNSMVM